MTDHVQSSYNEQKEQETLIGLPDEQYYDKDGKVDFIWKEKPLKLG